MILPQGYAAHHVGATFRMRMKVGYNGMGTLVPLLAQWNLTDTGIHY
jgi:hypothetical protein